MSTLMMDAGCYVLAVVVVLVVVLGAAAVVVVTFDDWCGYDVTLLATFVG